MNDRHILIAVITGGSLVLVSGAILAVRIANRPSQEIASVQQTTALLNKTTPAEQKSQQIAKFTTPKATQATLVGGSTAGPPPAKSSGVALSPYKQSVAMKTPTVAKNLMARSGARSNVVQPTAPINELDPRIAYSRLSDLRFESPIVPLPIFQIVAKLDDNTYEVIAGNSRAILKTVYRQFLSTGQVEIPATFVGHQTVSLKNGFSESWPVYQEALSDTGLGLSLQDALKLNLTNSEKQENALDTVVVSMLRARFHGDRYHMAQFLGTSFGSLTPGDEQQALQNIEVRYDMAVSARFSPLHYAINTKDNFALEAVLKLPGLAIDARDNEGRTALFLAAWGASADVVIVQKLVNHGANWMIPDNDGDLPLDQMSDSSLKSIILPGGYHYRRHKRRNF